MTLKKKLLHSSVALAMGATFILPSISASAAENNNHYEEKYTSPEIVEQMKPILQAIEDIPDDLLQEDSPSIAVNKYFKEKNVDLQVYNEAKGETSRVKRGAWSCSLAIGELIVTNAIPIAKLVKIKKYVKALGGAWNTAKLLVGATHAHEKWALIAGLMAELSGFTDVKEECGF
ncbi:hypothetical protein [Bacillus sp. FSL K6-0067]|uniref:hypothetical protein n=1 Tax=Bacillus sp. FSL K6-0067 TaxID=2921412 RepID=UPI00077A1741|nr:hypothetical protein AT267_03795 [Bacillus cereus]